MGMAAENRRTRRFRRKNVGWVGEHIDGRKMKRKDTCEPHAPTCMRLKEVLDTEDVCFRIKQLRNIERVI